MSKGPKTPAAPAVTASRKALTALIALSGATAALALYQWYELIVVRRGGHAICGINSFLDCESVWNSPSAGWVHRATGVPVAGLGLVWAVAALFVASRAFERVKKGQDASLQLTALRGLALMGVISCAGFAALSVTAGALCLTCLGTYALVVAFAVVTWTSVKGPPLPAGPARPRAALWLVVPPFVAYVLALGPGMATPRSPQSGAAVLNTYARPAATAGNNSGSGGELEKFLASLPPNEQAAVSQSLDLFRGGASAPEPTPRALHGSPGAAVRIQEWTDILCPHCRVLGDTLNALIRASPPGSVSVDARQFPLDSECNPLMKGSDGTHLRCLGAKAQLCLEGTPDFWRLRDQLFQEQASLTEERIKEIASSGSLSRAQLDACLVSPETQNTLLSDIAQSRLYPFQGTPLVVVNGREATSSASFLYALVLANGNADAPAFVALPPAPPHDHDHSH